MRCLASYACCLKAVNNEFCVAGKPGVLPRSKSLFGSCSRCKSIDFEGFRPEAPGPLSRKTCKIYGLKVNTFIWKLWEKNLEVTLLEHQILIGVLQFDNKSGQVVSILCELLRGKRRDGRLCSRGVCARVILIQPQTIEVRIL